jgi:hypothetical protein
MSSTWELHFEIMPTQQMEHMENFLAHIKAGSADAIDWVTDQEGLLHVMFEDLQHLRMVIDACDHIVQMRSLTVEFNAQIPDRRTPGASHTANAKIKLPWQVDDSDHQSIELVTT